MISTLCQRVASPESDVWLWRAHLDAIPTEAMARLAAVLSAEEQIRAARFRFDEDRSRYVATRGLLRRLLGAELEQEPATLVFAQSERGKPMLASVQPEVHPLRFNISHAGGWAMFAFAWEREIGVDLESAAHLRNGDNLSAIAERVLSAREFALWCDLPNESLRRAVFLRAWTRKEAYAKATGRGLAEQLREIEVILDSSAPHSSLDIAEWRVHDLPAPEGFAAAMAVVSVVSVHTPHAQR